MSSEEQTIYDFDLQMIYDYFSQTERQGPGSPAITLKALSFVGGLNERSKIADIGCGTGGQTMVLAQNTAGEIMGIDSCADFVEKFNRNAQKRYPGDRVKAIVGDMKDLPFEDEELDLIWCEGAIYNIGFKHGIKLWRRFLKPGGYIAVTENTWFTEERPKEIQEFWDKAYPEIDTISNKVAQMQKAGYLPVATFVVPGTCWTDYYASMQASQPSFLERHKGSKGAEEFIGYQQHEAELYKKYKEYYGYVFYVGRKILSFGF